MTDLFERAQRVLPGGVNSPVRAMRQIGRDPVFIDRAEGCLLFDVEGNRYIDWIGSWGPMILGHAEPAVVAAVIEAAKRGTSFGAATLAEVRLAEEVAARMPSVEMVRMTSSGTEAAMSAVCLARAVTGREVVVKFAGAYHGHSDGLLADAGSGLATLGVPGSPGVTAAQAALTVVVPWNDREAVERALREHKVAALLAEPIAANMGVVPPAEGFLEFLREATREAGALLVFDEVITGFRVARGGAQELFGVEPDLTVMGKVIGGGLPSAAYGGPREQMERIAPAGDVYQAGTLSGNPLAVAAGLATLGQPDAPPHQRPGELTDRPPPGLQAPAADPPPPIAPGPPLRPPPPPPARRLRGPRGAPPPADPPAPGPRPPLLHPAPGGRLRGGDRLRHRCPRALLPRPARARRLPAPGPVRGLVRLPRPRRGDDRPDAGSSRGRARRGPRLSRGSFVVYDPTKEPRDAPESLAGAGGPTPRRKHADRGARDRPGRALAAGRAGRRR